MSASSANHGVAGAEAQPQADASSGPTGLGFSDGDPATSSASQVVAAAVFWGSPGSSHQIRPSPSGSPSVT